MASVKIIGVVGAGAMGSGIVQSALATGYDVTMYDQQPEATEAAAGRILDRLSSETAKGRMPSELLASADRRLARATALDDFRNADFIVEAVVEKLEVKRTLFKDLETIVASDCVLASNTSSLSIAAIARDCIHPERVCGMHFFNPVPLMRLVEIVRGPATADDALAMAHVVAQRLGKVAIDVVDAPGFLVNLGGRAFYTEALHLLQEGAADAVTIDAIMREAGGFRMGPFELMDLTGIDVNFPVTKLISDGYQGEPRLKTTYLHQLMVDAGKYGRKTGAGFHDYRGESAPRPAPGSPRELTFVHFAADDRLSNSLSPLLCKHGLAQSANRPAPILIEPLGEDAATVAAREGLDASRVVAIDGTGAHRNVLTIMAPLGAGSALEATRAWLTAIGFVVHSIADTPGFVAPRILAMIANLGCEIAQMQLASLNDIDRAMELGLNYPAGPLQLADDMGPTRLHCLLTNLQQITGSDRYRPSLWLRQRSLLGLSAKTPR